LAERHRDHFLRNDDILIGGAGVKLGHHGGAGHKGTGGVTRIYCGDTKGTAKRYQRFAGVVGIDGPEVRLQGADLSSWS